MATRQADLELDFTQDESEDEPPSALAQQEASTREDENPGDQPTKEDYESEEEPIFKEIHEQYDRLAEKGEDEPLADLYKDRFVQLYVLSGDQRSDRRYSGASPRNARFLGLHQRGNHGPQVRDREIFRRNPKRIRRIRGLPAPPRSTSEHHRPLQGVHAGIGAVT